MHQKLSRPGSFAKEAGEEHCLGSTRRHHYMPFRQARINLYTFFKPYLLARPETCFALAFVDDFWEQAFGHVRLGRVFPGVISSGICFDNLL